MRLQFKIERQSVEWKQWHTDTNQCENLELTWPTSLPYRTLQESVTEKIKHITCMSTNFIYINVGLEEIGIIKCNVSYKTAIITEQKQFTYKDGQQDEIGGILTSTKKGKDHTHSLDMGRLRTVHGNFPHFKKLNCSIIHGSFLIITAIY